MTQDLRKLCLGGINKLLLVFTVIRSGVWRKIKAHTFRPEIYGLLFHIGYSRKAKLCKLTYSRRCSCETGWNSLVSLLRTFCFIALALRDLLSSGCNTATQTNTVCPAAKMFKMCIVDYFCPLPYRVLSQVSSLTR